MFLLNTVCSIRTFNQLKVDVWSNLLHPSALTTDDDVVKTAMMTPSSTGIRAPSVRYLKSIPKIRIELKIGRRLQIKS